MQQENNESDKKPKQPQPEQPRQEAVRKAKLRMLMKAMGTAEPEEMPEEIANAPIIYRRK